MGDLEEAFLQGKRITRFLCVRQPAEGVPGLDSSQLLQLEVEVYGTVRGSANRRETIVADIINVGCVMCKLDACAFTLPPERVEKPKQLTDELQSPFEDSEWLVPRHPRQESQEFKENDGNLDYGSLAELGAGDVVDQALAGGTRSGYLFRAGYGVSTSEFLWFATAEPVEPGRTGSRYFAVNQDGVVFYTTSGPFRLNLGDCAMPPGAFQVGRLGPPPRGEEGQR